MRLHCALALLSLKLLFEKYPPPRKKKDIVLREENNRLFQTTKPEEIYSDLRDRIHLHVPQAKENNLVPNEKVLAFFLLFKSHVVRPIQSVVKRVVKQIGLSQLCSKTVLNSILEANP